MCQPLLTALSPPVPAVPNAARSVQASHEGEYTERSHWSDGGCEHCNDPRRGIQDGAEHPDLECVRDPPVPDGHMLPRPSVGNEGQGACVHGEASRGDRQERDREGRLHAHAAGVGGRGICWVVAFGSPSGPMRRCIAAICTRAIRRSWSSVASLASKTSRLLRSVSIES